MQQYTALGSVWVGFYWGSAQLYCSLTAHFQPIPSTNVSEGHIVETDPQCFYEIDNATTLAWKNAQVTPIPPKM